VRPPSGSLPPVFRADGPLVFAHRGGAKLAPENTLAAFANGLAHGADGLELDVHLSRDGVPVVIHDATLDRTTDRTGPVSALTAAELSAVDAGYRFGEDRGHPFRGRGHGVPRLWEVLTRHASARVIVEIKATTPEAGRVVAALLRDLNAVPRVCVGSFHAAVVGAVRRAAPEIATSASEPEARHTLHRSWVGWPFSRRRPYVAFQVPERAGKLRVVSRRFIRQVHREGQVLQVWVVDDPAEASRLLEWGVDGLITDRPDVLVPLRDAWAARARGDAGGAARRVEATLDSTLSSEDRDG
jgi:glycerophosphoryl diester phosphodiesterase